MKEVLLDTEVRDVTTKHHLKALRAAGKVPAVFYGHAEKPVAVAVEAKTFDELIKKYGANTLMSLKLSGGAKMAIVKEIQRDIITQKPIHIDFQAVSMTEKIEISVPLHIAGIAPGVKNSGGILEHLLREIRVRCLPADIPQVINVDVSALEINHGIAVKDLPALAGVEFLTDGIIVNVVVPAAEEVAAPAAGEAAAVAATPGAAGAEPEVIAKGKKDKEDEAAAGDKKAEPAKK